MERSEAHLPNRLHPGGGEEGCTNGVTRVGFTHRPSGILPTALPLPGLIRPHPLVTMGPALQARNSWASHLLQPLWTSQLAAVQDI